MKSIVLWLLAVGATIGIIGCATMRLPDASLINSLPIIELGQESPDSNQYVLLLRAGVNIPVTVAISGSLLSKEGKTNTTVQLKRDLYLYQEWSSLDGKTWRPKNINLLIAAGLDPTGGKVDITVDQIPK